MTIRRIFIAFIAAILFMIFIHKTTGIKCWKCQSHSDPKCADPFDNSSYYMTDCDFEFMEHMPNAKATMCRKIRQKVEGEWRFVRSCAFVGEVGEGTGNENHCLMRTGTYDIFMEYCTCNSKDGCNAGNLVRPPVGIPGLVSTITFMAITSSWWYHWNNAT